MLLNSILFCVLTVFLSEFFVAIIAGLIGFNIKHFGLDEQLSQVSGLVDQSLWVFTGFLGASFSAAWLLVPELAVFVLHIVLGWCFWVAFAILRTQITRKIKDRKNARKE